ncbi:MAG: IS66 family transposase, partial [Bacteroides sp.]
MDIQTAIKNLRIQMDSMQLHLDSSHEEICKLNRNNQRVEKENHALRQENKELKERRSKYEQPSKDSNNSSTPLSKENLKSEVIRRTNSLREKPDRPVGGQQGHEGHMRKMVATPDKIVEHTSCFCTNCGRDLSDIESTLEYTTQKIDIPLTSPIISEHRYRAKICNCGCCNRSYAPKKKGGNDVTFGKNIQVLV